MTEVDVTQEYIRTLEETIVNLTKNKLVLDTNVNVLNKILELKENKIQELGKAFQERADQENSHHKALREKQDFYENEFIKLNDRISYITGANEELKKQLRGASQELEALKKISEEKPKKKRKRSDIIIDSTVNA